MAKNDAELQALEQPKSRNEEYLNFLCGRAVDINALPSPYSREEHYLEYLCHNRGAGGGGGQVPPVVPYIIDAILNGKIIEFTLSDGSKKQVDLDKFPILNEVNDFTKDNWFNDVILSKASTKDSANYGAIGNQTSRRYIGVREHSSEAFKGYISHVRLYCNAATTLNKVSGVKVYSVTKGATANDDRVSEKLIDNGSYEIQTETGNKYIEISINKKFENDSYLLIYDNSTPSVLKARNGVASTLHSEIVNSAAEPNISQAPVVEANAKYVYDMVTYGGVSLKEAIENLGEMARFLSKDKASLNKDNVFLGKNTFNEGIILGKNEFVSTGGQKQGSAHKTNIYCGDRRVSTHYDGSLEPKYISAMKIEVMQSLNVGDIVSGIHIAEVEKRDNRVNDIVRNKIVDNGSCIVELDENGTKVIYVPIQKEYLVNTYFLVGKTGARELRESWDAYAPMENFVNNININDLPATGSPLNAINGNGWIIIHSLTDSEKNIREELEKINNLETKVVKSVNNQIPVDGNVTINAEHIGYDNTTSNLISDNVQNAIDELKRDMALLENSNIYIKADKTEVDNLLQQNVLKTGDIVYIINSTDVVDYNDTNVNNNGNPVAMIYDDSVAGNHLRVFSKFSTTVNITANNVEYDDTQTQLQAQNVQTAIVKLNEKIVNAGTITSINGVRPQNGEVTLTATVTQDVGQDIVLQVGNHNFATLQCTTEQEVDAIIDALTI